MKLISRERTWLPVAMVIFLALGACTKDIDVEIFNNTGSPVGRMFGEQSIVVEKNSFYQSSSIELVRGIVFRIDGKIFSYKFPSMDAGKFWKLVKHGTLRLQLNSDGRIYVVAPGAQLPTSQYPEQPDNYPLEPIK